MTTRGWLARVAITDKAPVAFDTEWLDGVHAVPTEVSNFVQRRHGLTVVANVANVIDDSKHATSATGLASCGNRSNIDAGKRTS